MDAEVVLLETEGQTHILLRCAWQRLDGNHFIEQVDRTMNRARLAPCALLQHACRSTGRRECSETPMLLTEARNDRRDERRLSSASAPLQDEDRSITLQKVVELRERRSLPHVPSNFNCGHAHPLCSFPDA